MALRNYEEIDEDDYYGQDFVKVGKVSIWIGLTTDEDDPEDLDVLQDLCGIGYYSLDNQDMNSFDFKETDIKALLVDLSYSKSFSKEVYKTARVKGYTKARWILAQYDFSYDPTKVKRKIEKDPIFLGAYNYRVL